jgi:rod shape-determining protein MreB
VALDLGTATTRLRVAPRLAPLSRPSAVWRLGGQRRALAGGVVVDVEAASAVVADLLRSVRGRWRRPSVLACVPTDASPAERAALVEAVLEAGAGAVCVAPEPLAAALGAGLDVEGPRARAVVDVGEGVTDCAVVRSGKLVASAALRVGVADLRAAVQRAIAEGLGVRVTTGEAERALREVGVMARRDRRRDLVVAGSPPRGIGPVLTRVDPDALLRALDPVTDRIADHVRGFVSAVPEELRPDLREGGLCLTGGGALLHGLLELLVGELHLAVARAPNPLDAVVEGAHRLGGGALRKAEWH